MTRGLYNGIILDRSILRKLADRKERNTPASNRYQPNRDTQRSKTRATQAENKKLVAEAKRLRKTTGQSWPKISNQLAQSPFSRRSTGKRLSPGRIRRIISESENR
jgi:hypothetical protein